MHALRPGPYDQAWLLVVAAPAEARAVASGADADSDHERAIERAVASPWEAIALTYRLHMVVAGVGKANASAAVARAYDPEHHAGVCSLGVAGALPGAGLSIGDLVVATRCVYADEGLVTPDEFVDVAAIGFPPLPGHAGVALACDLDALDDRALPAHTQAPVATVSTCAGTDAHANAVRARTGAACEAMEGAAACFTAKRLAPDRPVLELRVISNTTGDRTSQRWDLAGAVEALSALARAL